MILFIQGYKVSSRSALLSCQVLAFHSSSPFLSGGIWVAEWDVDHATSRPWRRGSGWLFSCLLAVPASLSCLILPGLGAQPRPCCLCPCCQRTQYLEAFSADLSLRCLSWCYVLPEFSLTPLKSRLWSTHSFCYRFSLSWTTLIG